MELFTIKFKPGGFGGYYKGTYIEEYESLIWTERFIEAGDMRLVFPATYENVKLIPPGTILGINTSPELMITNSREIENEMIVITGKTLETLFNDRYTHKQSFGGKTGSYLMNTIVSNGQHRYDDYTSSAHQYGGIYSVSHLTTEELDGIFIEANEDRWEFGPCYPELLQIANKYQVGMAIKWTDTTAAINTIRFQTYTGVDRTAQILFSPNLDNLANVKELVSNENSKNVVIAIPPYELVKPGGMADGVKPIHVSNRSDLSILARTFEFTNDDITNVGSTQATLEQRKERLRQMLRLRARAHLGKFKKTHVIDGEITSESQYKYYTQYNPNGDPTYRLGDKVKIAGYFGDPVTGFMSEYSQSADSAGERAWPAVSQFADSESSMQEGTYA